MIDTNEQKVFIAYYFFYCEKLFTLSLENLWRYLGPELKENLGF